MPSHRRVRGAAWSLVILSVGLLGCAPENGVPTPTVGADARAPLNENEQRGEGLGAVADGALSADAGVHDEEEGAPENPGLSQSELDERLRWAVWGNDLDTAAQLIEWGADVNAQDSTQQSAFLIATSEGRDELLRLTLEHGADVADLDSWNGTGLIRAAERGHWDVAGTLIRAGVDMHHVNRVGYQAIHEAVIFGRDDPTYHAAVRVLVAGGASLTTPSVTEGQTPLQMAQSRGFPEQIRILEALDREAPEHPEAALLASAASGDADALTLALRAGAAVDTRDPEGRTALEIAEDGGNLAAATVLRALGG